MELDQPPSKKLPTLLRYLVLLPDLKQAQADGNEQCPLQLAGHTFTATMPVQGKWSRLVPFLNVQGQLTCEGYPQRKPAEFLLACDAFLADCLSLPDLRTLRRALRRHDYGSECIVQSVRMLISQWWDYVVPALMRTMPTG